MFAQWLDTGVLTTAVGGAATGYTPNATGRVLAIRYVKTDYSNGVDVTVTVEGTGEAIVTMTDWNASAIVRPCAPIQDNVGADALIIAGGLSQKSPVVIANDRLKFVIAAGGDAHTGRFLALIGG